MYICEFGHCMGRNRIPQKSSTRCPTAPNSHLHGVLLLCIYVVRHDVMYVVANKLFFARAVYPQGPCIAYYHAVCVYTISLLGISLLAIYT